MQFKRSMPERFNGVFTKDLPSRVQDKIKTVSRFLEITEGAVIHAILADWVAREAAEIERFGKRTTSTVYPFQFDPATNIILGNNLFRLLKAEHLLEMAPDEDSAKACRQNLKNIRAALEPSEAIVAERIEVFLRWTYQHTSLSRTPACDKTLAYLIVLYQRAGFSDDQIKELLEGEAAYLKENEQAE